MIQHLDTKGILHDVYFKCTECGCRRCERPQWAPEGLTFLEGYFRCCECWAEFSYYEDAFTLVQSQLKLFDV
jgi:hypothetical protein